MRRIWVWGGRTVIWSAAVVGVAMSTGPAGATDVTYSGPSGGNWNNAGNWSGGAVPVTGDNVTIPGASPVLTVNYDANYNAPGLRTLIVRGTIPILHGSGAIVQAGSQMFAQQESIGVGAGPGSYTQTGGANTIMAVTGSGITASLTLGQDATSSGTYSLSGGTLTVPTETIGALGNGAFTQSGGTQIVQGALFLNGTYALSGTATLQALREDIAIGFGGLTGGSNAKIFTQTGGNNAVTDNLAIGGGPGFTVPAMYDLQAGSLSASLVVVQGGGTFNQSGGSLSFTNFRLVGGTVTGTVQNVGNFTYEGGTFSGRLINQGTVTIDQDCVLGNGVRNDATFTIPALRTVTASGAGFDNEGIIALAGGTLAGTGTNNGEINGFGTIALAPFTNQGQVVVAGGNLTLSLTGSASNINASTINVAGLQLRLASATGGAGDQLANLGTINLNGGAVTGDATLVNGNGGIISGPGTIAVPFTTQPGSVIQAPAGTTLLPSDLANKGVINLGGPTANVVAARLVNTGTIQGAGSLGGGVSNNGTIEAIGGTLNLGDAVANGAAGLLTASAGGKLLLSGVGLANNAGVINLTGGTFDNGGHALTNTAQISGFGTFRTGGLTNGTASKPGSVTLAGGASTVNGNVTNAAGSTIALRNNPALFTGNVINNGTVIVMNTTATFAGTYTENGKFIVDPSDTFFTDLTIGAGGTIAATAGDRFILTGNLTNASQAGGWDTSAAELLFKGGGTHQLNVLGPAGSYAWGTLAIEAGNTMLVNGNSATAANTVNDGAVAVTSGAASLGAISGKGTLTVGNAAGGPAAQLLATSFGNNSIVINPTGTLALPHTGLPTTLTLQSVNIGGRLDVGNNTLLIPYALGNDPIATIRSQLTTGYHAGAWDGPGLDTSAADPSHGLGFSDNGSGLITIKFTRYGDANLDGTVNFADLLILAQHYNLPAQSWDHGDFTYDGKVGFDDLLKLAQNYGSTSLTPGGQAFVAPAITPVPEPAALIGLNASLLALLRRRRSHRVAVCAISS